MQGSERLSCSNCWFNGLQHGSVGLTTGYCVEHRLVLRRSDETTCGRHVRKDLLLGSALSQQVSHQQRYDRMDGVQLVSSAEPVDNGTHVERDASFIRQDVVGDAVADYGELRTKIESLAMLRALDTFRGDLALFNLGRSYTNRCVRRDGRWTSGVHLLMWARRRLEEDPEPAIRPEDLRFQVAVNLDRQIELAKWGLVMLRLVFVSDVGTHAAEQGDDVGRLAGLAEVAAEESGSLSLKRLNRWVKSTGLRRIDDAIPRARYLELAAQVHQARGD